MVKKPEKIEKTRNNKINKKSEKCNIRGQRNARYNDRILSESKEKKF